MSDPVTNVEIEDVLSSIRRLVSAEERGEDEAARDDERGGEDSEKLVLTPAQRVDEASTNDSADAAIEYDIERPLSRRHERSLDGVEDAELVEGQPSQTGSDTADDRAQADDAVSEESVADAIPREDGDAAQADMQAHTGAHMPEPEDEEVDLKELEARIAGFEAAVAEQEDDWEPDGSVGDDHAAGPETSLPWQDAEAKLEWSDDATPSEASAETAGPEGEDDANAAEEKGATDGADETRAGAAWYSDEAVIDEEALRDMVSEIVRQELQGELGERITRNVRKLVRREIHRALMSQGIE